MATAKAINVRRQDAIGRITSALGVNVERSNRDAAMAEAQTLEAIADAVEDRMSPPSMRAMADPDTPQRPTAPAADETADEAAPDAPSAPASRSRSRNK